MFPSPLYMNTRPTVLYEPQPRIATTSTSSPRSAMPPRPPVNREQVTQEALDAERISWPPSFSCIADRRGSFTVRCPEESYSTENVAEALRLKQRMRTRQALKSMALDGSCTFQGPPDLVPSYPSSCASSPASSPPPTPRLRPVDLPFLEQSSDLVACEGGYSGHWDRGSLGAVRARATDAPFGMSKRQRPSQSRSSIVHRSLYRHSSRGLMVSPSPPPSVTVSNTATAIVDIVRRLPPLPRFNPYRRARAESMSSAVDIDKRELGGSFCGLLPRRRCKSESSMFRVRLQ